MREYKFERVQVHEEKRGIGSNKVWKEKGYYKERTQIFLSNDLSLSLSLSNDERV